ncbi:MAG: biotin--[acetyl-CoA-carboxylase] ligase [Rhodococcus sp.]|uniref:biotin--[acetyl-CoA-carboxylase] ligase n=1 Tax=Rhodococcus TaxID=1827 RepID=UPI0016AF4F30|nr:MULTISPECIES: biotin--[acetyl-CoA-carboxylase] ligase [Rhodococcus]NLV80905.1 biotin--[acetyl-CoA-carboxylase] ligase [Rhodococcus sp. (in: high G+C Gram-positive bacteria)]
MRSNSDTAPASDPRAPFDVARLRRVLVDTDPHTPGAPAGAGFYSRVDVVAETGSTNADLLADTSSTAGTPVDRRVLLAEHQTGGRGRHARPWAGVPGAQVIVSVLVRLPGVALADLGWLPLLTGIATVDAVREVTGVPAELKWPNDVLVDGRKLAGILVEVASTSPVPTVVSGVGLNVSLTEDELPVPTATSLWLAGARDLDRTHLAEALLAAFADRMRQWERHGWDPTVAADAYRQRCSTIGKRVRAILPGDTELHGEAVDIDEQGRIVILPDGDGEPVAIAAGDITHLRPV